MRVGSYSLILSLVFAVFIFTGVSSHIFNSLLYKKEVLQQRQIIQDNLNSLSGIEYALSNNLQPDLLLQLYPDRSDSIALHQSPWGVFSIVSSSAFRNGRYRFTKSALIGSEIKRSFSLYLVNTNRALSLSGKSTIEGNCILPQLGVKRAYIEGKSFEGTQLVSGKITKHKVSRVPQSYLPVNLPLPDDQLRESDSVIEYNDELNAIINPFTSKRIVVVCPNDITYLHGYFKGNVILYSPNKLILGPETEFKDVIVQANEIQIEGNQRSSGQFFAHHSITCSEVTLNYPSILSIRSSKNSTGKDFIQIQNSSIDGGVYFNSESKQSKGNSGVQIDKASVIRGQLVSNANVELNGTVYGQVIVHQFYLKTPSSVYENHLLDVTISMQNLPESFPLLANQESREIVKWLN